MGDQFYSSGNTSGFRYENSISNNRGKNNLNDGLKKGKEDEDLIIEENTVYEIDRECYERLRRQRKRKVQDRKN